MQSHYEIENVAGGVPVKMWTRGVPVEDEAKRQLANAARLPIVFRHIAAMPDVHYGIGATVGSVIPTVKAIIPAAVGVDIGCGMIAAKTTLRAEDLPDNLGPLRSAIERAVPHGRKAGSRDPGAWSNVPAGVDTAWAQLEPEFAHSRATTRSWRRRTIAIISARSAAAITSSRCASTSKASSGSCCIRDRAASATPSARCSSSSPGRTRCATTATCPTATSRTSRKARSISATTCVRSAGRRSFAALNREVMMRRVIEAAKRVIPKSFQSHVEAVNCHHNYVQREHHFGEDVYVTRKGAVSAKRGELGIIPGSMGARSYIVRGKGDPESFE